jgi:hypothetical protein
MTMNIKVSGVGNRISSFLLDGVVQVLPRISPTLMGTHDVEILVNGETTADPRGVRVVNFSDRAPDAAPLVGVYRGIHFGEGNWMTSGDINREDWQRHLYINGSLNTRESRELGLSSREVLLGFRAWTSTGTACIELESFGNPKVTFNVDCVQSSYRTGWVTLSTALTITIMGTVSVSDLKISSLTLLSD